MGSNIPINIQHAWELYNHTQTFLTLLWETYDHDFLEHYFPEITGYPPEPQDLESDLESLDDEEDIPF